MPEPIKHPITGCRADTLFGHWIIDEEKMNMLLNAAWTVAMDSASLKAYSERSQQMREEEAKGPPYLVKNGIATLHISGPTTKHPTSFQSLFGGTSSLLLQEKLRMIRADYRTGIVRGLMIQYDTPGGTAAGAPELGAAIAKTAKLMPVMGHAQDECCSAGLWGLAQCSFSSAGIGANVGSLGTMVRLMERGEGKDKPIVIASSPLKGIGAGPLTDVQKEELQRYVNSTNEVFKKWVQQGRGLTDLQLKEAATAKVFVGAEALEIGLIDAVCNTDEAYERLQETIRTGKVTRSAGPVQEYKPASSAVSPPRSRVMLKPEQLTQARSLPGAENITAENADEVLLQIATGQQSKITDLQSKIPSTPDPSLVKGHAALLHGNLDLLAQKGNLMPEQVKLFKDVFSEQNASLVMPLNGKSVGNTILSVLELNKPNGVTKELTAAQPVAPPEPGNSQEKQEVTVARQNELRATMGLKPVTQTSAASK